MPNISEEYINALKSKIDITDLISSYVQLKRSGSTFRGLCPFHNEKTPSFFVYPDTQSFYCFGCGTGGDMITFIRDIEHLDYTDALKMLADKAGMDPPDLTHTDDSMSVKRRLILEMNRAAARFYSSMLMTKKGAEGLAYLRSRKLSDDTIRHFGLGAAPDDWHALTEHLLSLGYSYPQMVDAGLARMSEKDGRKYYYDYFRNRVMTPIIDIRGNVVAFGARVLDDSKPKYLNTSDTLVYKKSETIFGLNFAKSSGKDELILVEGYMDVITLHQSGFTNAVACCGTALTAQQTNIMSRYAHTVMLCYDNDEAGHKATDAAIQRFSQSAADIRIIMMEGAKDSDELIKTAGPERFRTLMGTSVNATEYELLKLKKRFNISADDGKNSYLEAASSVIAGIDSPIERDIYAARLANDFSVDKSAIMSRADFIRKKRKRSDSRKIDFSQLEDGFSSDPQTVRITHARDILLATFIAHPDLAKKFSTDISPGLFNDEFCDRLMSAVLSCYEAGRDFDITSMSGDFSPEQMSRTARLLPGSGAVLISGTAEECRDCINVLKEESRKSQQKDLASLSDEEFNQLFNKKKE